MKILIQDKTGREVVNMDLYHLVNMALYNGGDLKMQYLRDDFKLTAEILDFEIVPRRGYMSLIDIPRPE